MAMRTLHVVSHTHWDREWHQTFQQFRLKLVHLVDNLLDILQNDPQFKYFMLDGQTIILEDYLYMRPENEQILREHIQSGRILIGPWHILPDMFLVGPEAHIRNLLAGDRTTRKFGPIMKVGYMPDSFGHIGQMPQILRGFGIDTACLWRGLDEEPAEFIWQAPDGSRVLLAYLRDSYSNGAFLVNGNPILQQSLPHFAEAIAERGQALAPHSAGSDLLIMLGTDHMLAPPATSQNIAYANHALENTQVLHSTLPKYIAALQTALNYARLPVVQGELLNCKRVHLLPGVLSTRIWIKQLNNANENLLTKWAEPFSTFAELVQAAATPQESDNFRLKQPAAILRQAWRILMENHPHDSICGCSIDQVHTEMKTRFDQANQISEEITHQSLESLALHIDTRVASASELPAIIVFNPSSFPRTDLVRLELSLPAETSAFEIINEHDESIPFETLGQGSQELINALMKPKELHSALSMVNEGQITGLGIRSYQARRTGATMHIEITLSTGQPDTPVWQKGLSEITGFLADPTITEFQIRARTNNITRVVFTAAHIPALGWQTFNLKAIKNQAPPTRLPAVASAVLPLVVRLANHPVGQALAKRLQTRQSANSLNTIQNEYFKVEVEPHGTICVLDKRNGTLLPGLNCFMDGGDCGDEYNYSPPLADLLSASRMKEFSLHLGLLQQTLTINLLLKTPASLAADRKSRSRETVELPILTTITLTNGVPRIDIHTHLENKAKDHRLRVHFPTPFQVESADYDGHFEIPCRKIGLPAFDRQNWVEDPRPEVPQRAFTDISEENRGLTIANLGLPEVEVRKISTGTEIALTLLRCVGWLSRDDFQTRRGHAGPMLETPAAQMPGPWDFDYSIIPHLGKKHVIPGIQAYAFETPLRAVSSDPHSGDLPSAGSFIKIVCSDSTPGHGASAFTLSTVKQAEDGSGWLVRGYNPGPETLDVTLTPLKPFRSAARVNLAEEKLAGLITDESSASVKIQVKSQEIVSVWFEF